MSEDMLSTILAEIRHVRTEINGRFDDVDDRHDKLDDRVRSTEHWQHDANGKITMLSLVGVAIGSAITWMISIFQK